MTPPEIVFAIIAGATVLGALAWVVLGIRGALVPKPSTKPSPVALSYMNVERQRALRPPPRCRWCKAEMRAYETTCKVCGGSR